MSKIKVSAVKYTNSIPFIFGLQNHSVKEEIILSLDTPADCYNNLVSGKVEIGLVPIIIKNHVNNVYQLSPYGICSNGNVLSVILVSQSPLNEIKTITLDYQSKTSVMLTRLLCRDFWKINPEFIEASHGFEDEKLHTNEARLLIGDRAFAFHNQKKIIVTDLAGEWTSFTGLPFVFAFWASLHKLPLSFEQKFSEALGYGIANKMQLAKKMSALPEYKSIDLSSYLNENIIHEINPAMQEGMNLFLHLIRDLQ
jgi:chorismate dehydratase